MTRYDWLIFLHVLGAFATIGALTALWALVLGSRPGVSLLGPESVRQFGQVGGGLVGVGMVLTLLFGIWLAIDLDGYELSDAWILISLVLWAIGGWAGGKAGQAFGQDPVAGRSAGIRYQAVNSVAVLVILALMVWKPGA